MPIKNFYNVGQVGVVTDVPNFELPPNGWSDARNVRFVGNHIEAMKGFEETYKQLKFNNGNNDKYINCLTYRNLYTDQGRFRQSLIIATEKDIYEVTDSDTTTSRSKVISKNNSGYHATRSEKWMADSLSNAIVMTNIHDVPQGLDAVVFTDSNHVQRGLKFVDLPGWGQTTGVSGGEYWRTPVLRPYKNFLLALSTKEGKNLNGNDAVEFKQRVRWSDIAPINELPPNWDAASTTGSSGYNDLTDSIGQILDGLPMKDNFIIYTTDDVFIMQYVGGSQIFVFRKLFSSEGIISTGAVAEFEGQHFVVSKDDIYVHNGQTYKTIAKGKIKERFFRDVRTGKEPHNIMVKADPTNKEVWVLYKSKPARANPNYKDFYYGTEEGSYDTAAIWNWQYDTWTFRDLPPTSCAEHVPAIKKNIVTWATMPGKWNSKAISQKTWDSYGLIEGDWVMELGSTLGGLWRADVGDKIPIKLNTSNNEVYTSDMVCYMERASVDFRVEEMPMDSFKKVKYLYPQFIGRGEIFIKVGESDMSPKVTRTSQTFQFNMQEDYKADFRTNSRYLSVRFESVAQNDWRLADYSVDFEVGAMK